MVDSLARSVSRENPSLILPFSKGEVASPPPDPSFAHCELQDDRKGGRPATHVIITPNSRLVQTPENRRAGMNINEVKNRLAERKKALS
jgi:hypothetical protein